MTIQINGTSGISGVDGSAATPALQGTDSNTGISFGTDEVNINTGGNTAVTVDSSQRVGIGTTVANSKLSIGNGASTNDGLTITFTGDNSTLARFYADTATGQVSIGGIAASYYPVFYSAGSERARIDTSGRLLVGTSSAVNSSYTGGSIQLRDNAGGTVVFKRNDGTNTNSLGILEFHSSFGRAALIEVFNDGTHSGSSTPGAIKFSTTPSGTFGSPTERMRIHNSGKLTVPGVYAGTTTGGSAVYVESDGDLLRFTSSLKYKTDVETLEDARADAILDCRPVWYRSKCENDIKSEGSEKSDWGWYGFIAEEVAEIEPRLVNWATKDAVTQEDGSVQSVERDPADYEAEGVRYDNFVPLLLNLIKRQKEAIETLETRVAQLEGGTN